MPSGVPGPWGQLCLSISSIRALELREAASEEEEVPVDSPEHSRGGWLLLLWLLEPADEAPGMGMPSVVETSMPVTR